MSVAILTKWGNSMGLRIPASELKAAHVQVGQRFNIQVKEDGGFILTPLKNLQDGWLEAFNTIADTKQNEMLVKNVENDFDKDEWEW